MLENFTFISFYQSTHSELKFLLVAPLRQEGLKLFKESAVDPLPN